MMLFLYPALALFASQLLTSSAYAIPVNALNARSVPLSWHDRSPVGVPINRDNSAASDASSTATFTKTKVKLETSVVWISVTKTFTSSKAAASASLHASAKQSNRVSVQGQNTIPNPQGRAFPSTSLPPNWPSHARSSKMQHSDTAIPSAKVSKHVTPGSATSSSTPAPTLPVKLSQHHHTTSSNESRDSTKTTKGSSTSSSASKESSTTVAAVTYSSSYQSGLPKGSIIAIAIAVPVVIFLMIAGMFIYCRRRRYGSLFPASFSHSTASFSHATADYENPDGNLDTSYGGDIINEFSINNDSYDQYAARAYLGDAEVLAAPLQPATPQILSEEGLESPRPPTPPPKDYPTDASTPPLTKPSTPLRAAWRRAHCALKRSRAVKIKSTNSRVYPGVMDMHQRSPMAEHSTQVTKVPSQFDDYSVSQQLYGNYSQGRDVSNEEEDGLTHPCFRHGNFESRVRPRTPKTHSFSFGFSQNSSPARPRPAPAPPRQQYEMAQPDLDEDGYDWDDVDLGSSNPSPADLYHQIAYHIPEIHEPELDRVGEEHAATFARMSGSAYATSPGRESIIRALPTSLLAVSPAASRPTSSVYSTYIPPSATTPRRTSTRTSRFAQRGLKIRTTPLPTAHRSAKEYQEILQKAKPLAGTLRARGD